MASKYQKHVAEHAKRHPKDTISGSAGADQKLADLKEMLAAAADKERRSPYCDQAHVMRCEQIMAKLEQILARNGIKVR